MLQRQIILNFLPNLVKFKILVAKNPKKHIKKRQIVKRNINPTFWKKSLKEKVTPPWKNTVRHRVQINLDQIKKLILHFLLGLVNLIFQWMRPIYLKKLKIWMKIGYFWLDRLKRVKSKKKAVAAVRENLLGFSQQSIRKLIFQI